MCMVRAGVNVPLFVADEFNVFKDGGAAELVSDLSGPLQLSCRFCKSHAGVVARPPHAGT